MKEPLLESPTAYGHSLPMRNYSVPSIAPPYDYHHHHGHHRNESTISSPTSSTSHHERDYSFQEDPFAYTSEPTSYARPQHSSTTPSSSSSSSAAHNRPLTTRPRSRSKPADIFIHPTDSNLARADAAAQQLGVSGDTDRVKSSWYPTENDTPTWETGKGRDIAREMLGSASRKNTV